MDSLKNSIYQSHLTGKPAGLDPGLQAMLNDSKNLLQDQIFIETVINAMEQSEISMNDKFFDIQYNKFNNVFNGTEHVFVPVGWKTIKVMLAKYYDSTRTLAVSGVDPDTGKPVHIEISYDYQYEPYTYSLKLMDTEYLFFDPAEFNQTVNNFMTEWELLQV